MPRWGQRGEVGDSVAGALDRRCGVYCAGAEDEDVVGEVLELEVGVVDTGSLVGRLRYWKCEASVSCSHFLLGVLPGMISLSPAAA